MGLKISIILLFLSRTGNVKFIGLKQKSPIPLFWSNFGFKWGWDGVLDEAENMFITRIDRGERSGQKFVREGDIS